MFRCQDLADEIGDHELRKRGLPNDLHDKFVDIRVWDAAERVMRHAERSMRSTSFDEALAELETLLK